MGTELQEKRHHHGENIKILRHIIGMSQRELADKIHTEDTDIIELEKTDNIDDDVLNRISEAMGIPVNIIKEYDRDNVVNYIISNNTFNDSASLMEKSSMGGKIFNTDNPLEKIVELYERLLQEKQKRIEYLENLLDLKKE